MFYNYSSAHMGMGSHRVMGNIWCLGAGKLSLHHVRVANLASLLG